MREQPIEINGSLYTLKIHFENRRYSRASVSKNSINIRIPDFMPEQWKKAEAEKLKKWAFNKISENPHRFGNEKGRKYQSGDEIHIFGMPYILDIKEEKRKKCFAGIYGSVIKIRLPKGAEKQIARVMSRLISKAMLPNIEGRVRQLNEIHFKSPIKSLKLKNNKSTWGSCSPKGEITLATKLLLAPKDIIDYVIIHELAHMKERNHSRRFWQTVEETLPDYKERRKWLRKSSSMCRF